MDSNNMVHRANQIALNFASYPHADAVAKTATHLKMYWEPRMKKHLHEYVAKGGGGLHELVLEAEKQLK
jgi:formate dehydrogenase subunit delta